MKILFCGRYLNSPIGGAELSARNLLNYLLSRGHQVAVFTISNDNPKKIDWPYPKEVNLYEGIFSKWFHKKLFPGELMNLLIERKMNRQLDEICFQFEPELILSQSNLLVPTSYSKAKKVFFVHDYGFGSTMGCASILKALINKPFTKFRRVKMHKFDLVITVSLFMQSILGKFGIGSEVIYPLIDFSKYLVDADLSYVDRKYITFIRPTRQKGVEIAIKIAELLSNREFLFVGQLPADLKNRVEGIGNIKYLPWQRDMKEVYRKTRLLIVPSIWNEPSSCVVTESALNGIPAIASNRGGFGEKVREGGILINDIWNIFEWEKAINQMDNKKNYDNYSVRAKEISNRFTLENNLMEFTNILKDRLGIII